MLSSVLINDCGISSAVDNPTQTNPDLISPKFYKALWDTGATNTSITKKVAEECNLKPVSATVVNTASGQHTVDVFLASIYLPNGIAIAEIAVNEAVLQDIDILIGMDIIGMGDFAVSNYNGMTQFSFRVPSIMHIDLGKLGQAGNSGGKKRNRR